MDDAGFIIGSYLLTFAMVVSLAWGVLRAGRRLSKQVPAEDKYWL